MQTFDNDVTRPRRRSNHCATIVRDDRVRVPCPLNRRHPNPMLSTAMPTGTDIDPTTLSPSSVPANPSVAVRATTREPNRSMA